MMNGANFFIAQFWSPLIFAFLGAVVMKEQGRFFMSVAAG